MTSYDLRHLREDPYCTSDATWTDVTDVWTAGDLSYELTGLAAGYSYDLRVRAVNDAGAGTWSEPLRSSTNPVSPGEPAIERIVVRDGKLDVLWGPPAFSGGASTTSYDLTRG